MAARGGLVAAAADEFSLRSERSDPILCECCGRRNHSPKPDADIALGQRASGDAVATDLSGGASCIPQRERGAKRHRGRKIDHVRIEFRRLYLHLIGHEPNRHAERGGRRAECDGRRNGYHHTTQHSFRPGQCG